MVPGDPARVIAGDRAKRRDDRGDPPPVASGSTCRSGSSSSPMPTNLLAGDIGQSLRFQRPVSQLIQQFMWPTLFLTGYVVCLAVPPSIALAILSARQAPAGPPTRSSASIGIAGLTIPVFWLGIMMSRFFGVSLGWFPVSGYGVGFTGHLHHLFLPALSTAIWLVPVLTQSLRAALIEKAMADFVTAARAQGASEREIFWRTILPNSVLPTLNLLGVMVAFMIGGAVIVETVYAVPGLGTLMISALLGRDYHVVQGLTLVFATPRPSAVTFAVDLLCRLDRPARGPLGDHGWSLDASIPGPHRPAPDARASILAGSPSSAAGCASRWLRPLDRALRSQCGRHREHAVAAGCGALVRHRPGRPRRLLPRPVREPRRLVPVRDRRPAAAPDRNDDRPCQRLFRRRGRQPVHARLRPDRRLSLLRPGVGDRGRARSRPGQLRHRAHARRLGHLCPAGAGRSDGRSAKANMSRRPSASAIGPRDPHPPRPAQRLRSRSSPMRSAMRCW